MWEVLDVVSLSLWKISSTLFLIFSMIADVVLVVKVGGCVVVESKGVSEVLVVVEDWEWMFVMEVFGEKSRHII